MNKHNIVELCDYRKNKEKIKQEHHCFEFLDSLKDRIKMSQVYAKSFKQYMEIMVKDGNIKKSFADNINTQVDMMIAEAYIDSKGAVKWIIYLKYLF